MSRSSASSGPRKFIVNLVFTIIILSGVLIYLYNSIGLLKRGVTAVLDDSSGFTISSSSAENTVKTAKELSGSLKVSINEGKAKELAEKLACGLRKCLFSWTNQIAKEEKSNVGSFHVFRTSPGLEKIATTC